MSSMPSSCNTGTGKISLLIRHGCIPSSMYLSQDLGKLAFFWKYLLSTWQVPKTCLTFPYLIFLSSTHEVLGKWSKYLASVQSTWQVLVSCSILCIQVASDMYRIIHSEWYVDRVQRVTSSSYKRDLRPLPTSGIDLGFLQNDRADIFTADRN